MRRLLAPPIKASNMPILARLLYALSFPPQLLAADRQPRYRIVGLVYTSNSLPKRAEHTIASVLRTLAAKTFVTALGARACNTQRSLNSLVSCNRSEAFFAHERAHTFSSYQYSRRDSRALGPNLGLTGKAILRSPSTPQIQDIIKALPTNGRSRSQPIPHASAM